MRTVRRICEPASAVVVDPLTRLYYAIRDQSVMANPYSFIGSPEFGAKPVTITPGTAMLVTKNVTAAPMMVAIQARGTANANKNYLFVAPTQAGCVIADAKSYDYNTAPKVAVLIAPNEEVWADVTDPDGGVADQVVNWASVPLHYVIEDF